MASQDGTSRLAQMQMRFQQKQRHEREQRKMEMTGSKLPLDVNDTAMTMMATTTTNTSASKSSNSSLGPGKVRQMFDERRRGIGIDKSYPLKPIGDRSSSSGSSTLTQVTSTSRNGGTIQKQQVSTMKQFNGQRITNANETFQRSIRNVNEINGNTVILSKNNGNIIQRDNIDNEKFPDGDALDNEAFNASTTLSNVGNKLASLRLGENRKSNGSSDRNNNSTIRKATNSISSITLKPVAMKKIISSEGGSLRANGGTAHKLRTAVEKLSKPSTSKNNLKMASNVKSPPPRISTPPSGTVACRICSRYFNEDRIEKHEVICQRTVTKKRKPFDAIKHRVKGTEAEKYLKKKPTAVKPVAASRAAQTSSPEGAKKSNWRRKHEDFIAAIRAAKQVQAHLAKGGKLSDLPPPPPSENPDYIQCPHCQRRFNEAAASRHIPKCANMLHNKPKPGASARKR